MHRIQLSGQVSLSCSFSQGVDVRRTSPALSVFLESEGKEPVILSWGFAHPVGIISRLIRPSSTTSLFVSPQGMKVSAQPTSLLEGHVLTVFFQRANLFVVKKGVAISGIGGSIILPEKTGTGKSGFTMAGLILHRHDPHTVLMKTGTRKAEAGWQAILPWDERPVDRLVTVGGHCLSDSAIVHGAAFRTTAFLRAGWTEAIGCRLSHAVGFEILAPVLDDGNLKLQMLAERGLSHLGWGGVLVRSHSPFVRRTHLSATAWGKDMKFTVNAEISMGKRPAARMSRPYLSAKRSWNVSFPLGPGEISTGGRWKTTVLETGRTNKNGAASVTFRLGTGQSRCVVGIQGERTVTGKIAFVSAIRWKGGTLTWHVGNIPVLSWVWNGHLGDMSLRLEASSRGELTVRCSWTQEGGTSGFGIANVPVADEPDFPLEIDAGFLEDSLMDESGEFKDI